MEHRSTFKIAEKNLKDTIWDSTPYDNLVPDAGSIESLAYQKIQDIQKQGIPRIVLATDEATAAQLFDTMLADIVKAGSEDVETIINANYSERMKNWE
jgi:putative aldouronate transport system substrate-binding protein